MKKRDEVKAIFRKHLSQLDQTILGDKTPAAKFLDELKRPDSIVSILQLVRINYDNYKNVKQQNKFIDAMIDATLEAFQIDSTHIDHVAHGLQSTDIKENYEKARQNLFEKIIKPGQSLHDINSLLFPIKEAVRAELKEPADLKAENFFNVFFKP